MEKIKKVVAYCRVSTERQEEQKTIESQKAEIQSWAQLNNFSINDWYIDDGWSGELLARPELDRLRDAAKEKLFDILCIYDLGRFSRDFTDQLVLLREFEEIGIEVISLHDINGSSDTDKFARGVMGLFHDYERKKIAERMRRGKMHKAKSGKIVGHTAPYGYRYHLKQGAEDGFFEIYEPEAEVVRMIFRWVADEGYSMRKVVRKLYELKIMPPKNKKDYWPKSSIARMLNRMDYIGISYFNKSESSIPKNPLKIEKYKRIKKSSRKARPKEDWIEIPDIPRIIDDDLFKRAKARMRENFLYGKRNKHYNYLLSGKVICACGAKRVGDPSNGHFYYRCAARIYNFPKLSEKCKYEGVNAEVLDAMVWNKLLELLANPTLVKSQAEKWNIKQSRTSDKSHEELKRLRMAVETLTDEEKRYTRAYASKLIDFNQYKIEMKEVKAKKEVIEGKIKDYAEKAPTDTINLNSFESVCDTIYYSIKHSVASEKQEYIRNLIVSIYVEERRKALVNGRIPVSVQAQNVGYESISRNCRVAKCRQVHFI